MPNRERRHCTCCGRHERDVGPISWGGNCMTCGQALLAENIVGIHEKQGPAHARRLRGYAKWLHRAALDAGMFNP